LFCFFPKGEKEKEERADINFIITEKKKKKKEKKTLPFAME